MFRSPKGETSVPYIKHGPVSSLLLTPFFIQPYKYNFFLISIWISGPRPDLDPDIVAALDDALDLDDPKNILEDDFVLKVGITESINVFTE